MRTIENALKMVESAMRCKVITPEQSDKKALLQTITEALQEKLEREKGCECCKKGKTIRQDCDNGYSLEIEGEEVSVWDGDACVAIFSAENCPMCGRKLKGAEHD